MSAYLKIKQDLEIAKLIGNISQVYEYIYITKVQKVRTRVLGSRQFIEGLTDIYNELRTAFKTQVDLIVKKKRKSFFRRFVKKNSAAIFVSSPIKTTSEVQNKVFNGFWEYIKSHNCEVFIIGQPAVRLYEQRGGVIKDINVIAIDESESGDLEVNLDLVAKLSEYDKVQVFYGQYLSMARQSDMQIELGNSIETTANTETVIPFLAEPTIKDLVKYFDQHLYSEMMKQMMHESYLATLGSRLLNLEQAISNAEKQTAEMKWKATKMKKRMKNRKALQQLAGLNFWSVR